MLHTRRSGRGDFQLTFASTNATSCTCTVGDSGAATRRTLATLGMHLRNQLSLLKFRSNMIQQRKYP